MSTPPRLPVVVLISGSGSNLQSLLDRAPASRIDIRAVFSDRADAHGLKRATNAGVPAHFVDPADCANRETYDRKLAAQIDKYDPGLVVLAGFMRILSPWFVNHYKDRTLNIHPSLLPNYRGLHTHRRVLVAGDRIHGCSIHFVVDELDGGPLIAQAMVDVLPGDNESTLSARVQAREHKLYPLIIDWFATGRLRMQGEQILFDDEPLSAPIVYAQSQEIE